MNRLNNAIYFGAVYFWVFFGMSSVPLISTKAWAKSIPQTEIHVTLLGQPCLLQGPYDESTLRTIHAIGPAQVYPTLITEEAKSSKEQAKKAIDKIRSSQSLPSLLDRYREKLVKRLEAQIAFLDGLDSVTKKKSTLLLLKSAKRYLKKSDIQQFENLVKKLNTSSSKSPSQLREAIDQVFDFYNDGIEPDPEEEFHRAIKKLNVQYTCSFEESDDLGGD